MDCYYGQPQPLRFVPNPCIPSSSSSSNNPIYPFTTGGEAGGRTRPGLYLMTGGNEPAFPVPGWAAANPPTKKTLARSSPPAAAPAVQRPPTLAPTSLPFLGQQSLDSMAHAAAVCYHGAVAPHQHQVACEPHVEQPVEAQCTQQLPEIIPDNATILQEDCAAQLRQLADPNPRIAAAALAALPGAAVPACTWLPAEKGAEKNASTVPLPIVPLAALLGNLELDQGNRMPKVEKSGRSTTRKLYVRRTDTGKWLCAETNKWVTPGGRVEAVPWTLSGGPKGIVGSTIAYLKHGNNSITLKYIDGRVKLENPDGSHTSVNLVVHMRPSRATEEIARMPAVLLFTKAKPEEPEPKTKERGRADETKGQTKDYLVMDLEPVVRNFTELTTVLGGSGERDLPLLLWGLEKPLREFLREDRVPEHVTQQLERKLRALLLLGQGKDLGMGMHWDRPTSTSKALWSDTAGDEAAAPHQHHTQ